METAGKTGRTGFDAMLRHLRKHGTCTAILVEKTDRLYRNLKDWVTLDELGAAVHLVKEGVVLSDDSVSSEKFVHGIKVLMAKNYLDNLSEEVRKGMNEKVQQGHWPGKAPIGYRNVEGHDGKRIIARDPVLGPIVTRLFEWYSTGTKSLTEVTKMAGEAGLVTRQSCRPVPRSQVHKTSGTRSIWESSSGRTFATRRLTSRWCRGSFGTTSKRSCLGVHRSVGSLPRRAARPTYS